MSNSRVFSKQKSRFSLKITRLVEFHRKNCVIEKIKVLLHFSIKKKYIFKL